MGRECLYNKNLIGLAWLVLIGKLLVLSFFVVVISNIYKFLEQAEGEELYQYSPNMDLTLAK